MSARVVKVVLMIAKAGARVAKVKLREARSCVMAVRKDFGCR
jgi:hypothetical protein